jgi:hypothetical protein
MPNIMPHDALHQDFRQAIALKLGAPLIQFDQDGRPVHDYAGRVRYASASREARNLAESTMLDIGAQYLRQAGPVQLREQLGGLPRSKAAQLLMNRALLRNHFPGVAPTHGVILESATGDFPSLLADSLNKAVIAHWSQVPRTWRAYCRPSSVDDFKTANRIRLDDAPTLTLQEPGASIEFAHMPENPAETFALATYSMGLRFTRVMLINDDTEQLGAMTRSMGQAAGRLEDDLAYTVLTANAATADGAALFSTAHANILTGALSVTSLGAARKLIETRQTAAGDQLDHVAARLLVPTDIATAAEQVLDSTAAARRHEAQPPIQMVSSNRLAADSTTQWYLTTDPNIAAPVEMAFLKGRDQPSIDSRTHFDTDGLDLKVRHDLKAAAIDYRAIVRSTGT